MRMLSRASEVAFEAIKNLDGGTIVCTGREQLVSSTECTQLQLPVFRSIPFSLTPLRVMCQTPTILSNPGTLVQRAFLRVWSQISAYIRTSSMSLLRPRVWIRNRNCVLLWLRHDAPQFIIKHRYLSKKSKLLKIV